MCHCVFLREFSFWIGQLMIFERIQLTFYNLLNLLILKKFFGSRNIFFCLFVRLLSILLASPDFPKSLYSRRMHSHTLSFLHKAAVIWYFEHIQGHFKEKHVTISLSSILNLSSGIIEFIVLIQFPLNFFL